MRLYSSLVSFVFVCAAAGAIAQTGVAPTCSDLNLVPAVRECRDVKVIKLEQHGPSYSSDQGSPDENEILQELAQSIHRSTPGLPAFDTNTVVLLHADKPFARKLLAKYHLSFDPAMHDEGYVIVPSVNAGLAVIAETSTGLFYGAQTVKQLIRGSGEAAVFMVPVIRDWPAMPHRGLSDDWSRGPLPNMEFLKREIRTLAAFKYNIFSPYFEHTFAYTSTPVAAFPGGAMTPDEGSELVEYAAKYHITIIPEQEAFGHLHHVLKFEQYSPLGETPHGAVLAPGDPGTLAPDWRVVRRTGEGVSRSLRAHRRRRNRSSSAWGARATRSSRKDWARFISNFLAQIHQELEPNHKRLLFWGDIAENSPELVGTLPKDMIAVSWHYDAKPDFTKNLEPFLKSGLETWVAPGVNNWNRVYPNNNEALGNIRAFVRDGQKLGATGMLNTVWNDDGEGIFDENWFGVLFGAAAAWQPGESSEANFIASYGQAFHDDPTGKIKPGTAGVDGRARDTEESWTGRCARLLLLGRSVFAGRPADRDETAARSLGASPSRGACDYAACAGTRDCKARQPRSAGRNGTGRAADGLHRLQIHRCAGVRESLCESSDTCR